jgi:hypothetical protein
MWIQRLKILLVLCGMVSLAPMMWLRPSSLAAAEPAQTAPAAQTAQPAVKKDYNGKFTHQSHTGTVKVLGTNQTRELKCDYCHERTPVRSALAPAPPRNEKIQLDFPPHRSCIECHVVQFTAKTPETCGICHQRDKGMTARPPQRDFPVRYDYNLYFDTKQHEAHIGYKFTDGKALDCAFCHQPTERKVGRVVAQHPECYACHTPNSGDQKAQMKSDCIVCHTQMIPTPPPPRVYRSVAYGAKFSHQTHADYVQGRCDVCHTVTGGYNQPAPKPATIRIREHVRDRERSGKGCFSCHDGGSHSGVNGGRPVFSGEYGPNNSGSCVKCHSGDKFSVPVATG